MTVLDEETASFKEEEEGEIQCVSTTSYGALSLGEQQPPGAKKQQQKKQKSSSSRGLQRAAAMLATGGLVATAYVSGGNNGGLAMSRYADGEATSSLQVFYCDSSSSIDVDPEECAEADGQECQQLCKEGSNCDTLCGAACSQSAGAICGLAAYANLPTVCKALGHCTAGPDDFAFGPDPTNEEVQAWFEPYWLAALDKVVAPAVVAPSTKKEKDTDVPLFIPLPDSSNPRDTTTAGFQCDEVAWCRVCEASPTCSQFNNVSAASMSALDDLPSQCATMPGCTQ